MGLVTARIALKVHFPPSTFFNLPRLVFPQRLMMQETSRRKLYGKRMLKVSLNTTVRASRTSVDVDDGVVGVSVGEGKSRVFLALITDGPSNNVTLT